MNSLELAKNFSGSIKMNSLELAKNFSVTELINAIGVQSVMSANDMFTDFIADPDYVKTEGLPTRQEFVEGAISDVQSVLPETLVDEITEKQLPGESDWQFIFRLAVINAVNDYPELTKLTVDLSR